MDPMGGCNGELSYEEELLLARQEWDKWYKRWDELFAQLDAKREQQRTEVATGGRPVYTAEPVPPPPEDTEDEKKYPEQSDTEEELQGTEVAPGGRPVYTAEPVPPPPEDTEDKKKYPEQSDTEEELQRTEVATGGKLVYTAEPVPPPPEGTEIEECNEEGIGATPTRKYNWWETPKPAFLPPFPKKEKVRIEEGGEVRYVNVEPILDDFMKEHTLTPWEKVPDRVSA